MSTLKILVVDDEPGIRSGVSRILRNFRVDYPFMDEAVEFEVMEAATGEAGIEIIDTGEPDILLLDNKLPGIQGIEVLEYIKKKQKNIIVVMITSYASLELAVKATSDGAYDFIPKPFTPQELKSSVENITKRVFLKKMTNKLQDTGKQIRFTFLSVLSHELKAPLNAIEGYLKMIRDRQNGTRLEDYDIMIDRSLDRIQGMRNLILDLLDLTRVESGKVKRNIAQVDLTTIARTAMDTMRPYAIQRDVTMNLQNDGPVLYNCDAEEMEIIFNNLISNAIKYNKEGGRVDFTLGRENGCLFIRVVDTGIGMSQAELEKIFDDFVRIKNEKTKNISGSGLGLPIVRKMIDNYAGKIEVTSAPDQGSTFIVRLPIDKPCS
ncbi:MAG TPA: hybrid sensor histidine kinase/response regulator [Bacteroidales bacterium]|mgnify:CR=1 FL=1|nr:hybrid sensor histidine kinase/response regulator [Bacteroidales bacterium]HPS63618.1 hybrid sensor histidine kinase/response regulator [Bacteroidales bacterium]